MNRAPLLFALLVMFTGCRLESDGLRSDEPLGDGAVDADDAVVDSPVLDGSEDQTAEVPTDAEPADCGNRTKDGDETDIDCGGAKCPRCKPGASCATGGDCDSKLCAGEKCSAPTCFDGVANGEETDVDCGGAKCGPCKVAAACARGADCESSLCDAKVCRFPRSCKELHDAAPTLPSAQFTLDVDGPGPKMPFKTYCDMETDGGGWTFFAHVDGGSLGAGGPFFQTDIGTFRSDRVDDGLSWSLGATILPALSHTMMMLTLDSPDPATAFAAKKFVVFSYPAGALGFNKGPIPCSGLDFGFSFRTTTSGPLTSGAGTNGCDAGRWYATATAGAANYLTAIHEGSNGLYSGPAAGGNSTYGHDGFWYAR